ncbi:glycosyltransferase family 9 protein [Basfia succiniciproducens]|uniref:ADP-heptose:LPS heptosyltransferase n=1 Tax=Basfia succiniciproducens TaxID=653940 RepID=A0A1G5DE46_9PAST|nr:glycosyltransferase family 9 protein [Basfia succiniciproducens]QIM67916.1 heptosyltransferase [Basfia succiniciproducens]SCY12884.1 ADP-heptose:LPS heptosyltransferase [Basfia succiniciproducens]
MNLKNILRNLRLSLGKLLIDKKIQGDVNVFPPQRILFLRQDGKIGDYIVSSFVFRELKKANPNIHIGVICTQKDAYLFEQNPHIDQLYYVKKRDILDYVTCGLKLAKLQYDVVIDPTISLKNRDLLLLRLINARNYIGYKKSNYQLFNINLEGEFHFSELYRLALEKIGIQVQDMSYDVPYNSQSAIEISQFLEINQLKNYIAVNFFGGYRHKVMNKQNIEKYISYLTSQSDNPLVLLSYPEVIPMLKDAAKSYTNIFIHDTTTIFHTIELIRHCALLISTDTSTVHIASGFNKPMIAIYKEDPIAFIHWKPISQAKTHILYYKDNINELSPEAIKPEWLL